MAIPRPVELPPPERRPMAGRRPPAHLVLVAVCAAAFAASWVYHGDLSPRRLLVRPIDELTLIACGAKDRQLVVGAGEWWRLLSCGFLHAHLVHLAVNLYALAVLGPIVERLWGTRRFLILYVAALAAGSALSLAATPGTSVGASGAVFGLFGAVVVFAVVHRQFLHPRVRLRLWVNLAVVAAANLALGMGVDFIDNAAHAGGFAGGALAALVLRPVQARRERAVADLAVQVALAAAVVATVWSLASAVRFAASPATVLVARSVMEQRVLKGSGFELFVPKGWDYRPPEQARGRHSFERRGMARIVILALPRDQSGDLAGLAESEAAGLRALGAKLVATCDTAVGESPGIEMQFRAGSRAGPQRFRLVVFPTAAERHVSVTCVCPERQYPLLELLFDKVLQSIRPRLPQPRGPGAQPFWQRLAEDPGDVEAYLPLAAFYLREGRYGAAEQALRTALRLRPGYPDAYDQLAYLYAKAPPPHRNPAEAVANARKAIRQEPDSARYRATLATAWMAAGDRAKALAAARQAADLAPDDARYADLVKRLARSPSQP